MLCYTKGLLPPVPLEQAKQLQRLTQWPLVWRACKVQPHKLIQITMQLARSESHHIQEGEINFPHSDAVCGFTSFLVVLVEKQPTNCVFPPRTILCEHQQVITWGSRGNDGHGFCRVTCAKESPECLMYLPRGPTTATNTASEWTSII